MKITCITLLLCLTLSAVTAQDRDFEAWKRERERDMQEFATERDSILSQYAANFQDYVEKRNQAYADYLREEWEAFNLFRSGEPYESLKPEVVPDFDPVVDPEPDPEGRDVEWRAPQLQPQELPVEPVTIAVAPEVSERIDVTIDFYGREWDVPLDDSFSDLPKQGITEEDVADWLETAAQSTYVPSLTSILDIAGDTNMNDWALYKLTKAFSRKVTGGDQDLTRLYTWFLLQQAGYDIRLGRQDNQLVMLMPFADQVYNIPLTSIDNRVFGLLGGTQDEPLYAYRQPMDNAFRVFHMGFAQKPAFSEEGKKVVLSFEKDHHQVTAELQYDPVLVAMLKDQPQSDARVYFDSNASVYLRRAADHHLPLIIEDKDNIDQVAFLLKMVQDAFDYETDMSQFGMQKFMFPDEVIHYAASDCDDRAVLFAWLVRNYTNNQVAAVQYDDHMATAVHFSGDQPAGDYFTLDGHNFVISDPTFVNAPIGLTMPQYQDIMPLVWHVQPDSHLYEQELALWEELFEYGGRRANNRKDIAFDDNGNIYVTGYFSGSFSDGNIHLQGNDSNRTAFVASLDANMDLRWVQAFESDYNATGFTLTLDQQGHVVVAGSYRGKVGTENAEAGTGEEKPDLFVASFNQDGTSRWISHADLDVDHQSDEMAFACYFDLNGNPHGVNYFNDPRQQETGLFHYMEDQVMLKGTFGSSSGLAIHDAPELATLHRADYLDILLEANRDLIDNDVDPAIAGLFAAIKVIKADGVVFPGSAAQEAINKENPGFKRRFPNTFEKIGRINFMQNNSGLIEIRTADGKDVRFDKLRIRDESVIRTVSLANNNEQIEVVSRISVGQAFIWYSLNFVRLYHDTGDMLFDYGRSNSRQRMNVREDILN